MKKATSFFSIVAITLIIATVAPILYFESSKDIESEVCNTQEKNVPLWTYNGQKIVKLWRQENGQSRSLGVMLLEEAEKKMAYGKSQNNDTVKYCIRYNLE